MNKNDIIIKNNFTVRNAMKAIDKGAKGIVIVEDSAGKLCGTLTDGDIRRWILRNGSMEECVTEVMNVSPKYVVEENKNEINKIMKKFSINTVPIVNNNREIVDVKFRSDYECEKVEKIGIKENPVVIMAGGLGTRLYPYTKILPKPLIPIGDTPIVERIINKFNLEGANKFFLTVNYKKNMIKSYFNEIDKEYEVDYIEEDKPLGTGGSLSLLEGKIDKTFFVSNCDILVDADYEAILKHHKESNNKVTVVTSVKNFTIPYGIFELNCNGNIENIVEKPEYSFLINTGMYVLEPEVIDDIPKNEFYNLPDIIERYRDSGENVGVYPISEQSWMDMGQINEMQDMINRVESKENK